MSAAYSAFAKVGHGIPATSPSRIPRPVVLLALVVALVLATLPLVSAALDRRADRRNAAIDAEPDMVPMTAWWEPTAQTFGPTWPYRGEVN